MAMFRYGEKIPFTMHRPRIIRSSVWRSSIGSPT
jgi:hypothetical protein